VSSARLPSVDRSEYYSRLGERNTRPLWEVLARLVLPEPRPACQPFLWNYEDIRPLLLEAGELISATEAERRVLILENPGMPGSSQITQSLYAGIQLILPGEVAPSHRHTASALRFVIEGDGTGYTAVDGERTGMRSGDFVLTPSWTFHDHGNPGQQPVIWLDVLDIPIVNMLDASFSEHHQHERQPLERPEGDAHARYGMNMLPVEYQPRGMASPIFVYPYEQSREALHRLHASGSLDARHGVKLQYINPVTGSSPLPTIASFLQLLPRGFAGESYRSTDSTVYSVVEGRGASRIGEESLSWSPKDVFVVPSWMPVSHQAHEDAVLFSASDRPVQKALGMWREA
jgi:gentisate 1,2-dioxygenase